MQVSERFGRFHSTMEDRGDVSVLDMSECNAKTRAMVQAGLKLPTAKHAKVKMYIERGNWPRRARRKGKGSPADPPGRSGSGATTVKKKSTSSNGRLRLSDEMDPNDILPLGPRPENDDEDDSHRSSPSRVGAFRPVVPVPVGMLPSPELFAIEPDLPLPPAEFHNLSGSAAAPNAPPAPIARATFSADAAHPSSSSNGATGLSAQDDDIAEPMVIQDSEDESASNGVTLSQQHQRSFSTSRALSAAAPSSRVSLLTTTTDDPFAPIPTSFPATQYLNSYDNADGDEEDGDLGGFEQHFDFVLGGDDDDLQNVEIDQLASTDDDELEYVSIIDAASESAPEPHANDNAKPAEAPARTTVSGHASDGPTVDPVSGGSVTGSAGAGAAASLTPKAAVATGAGTRATATSKANNTALAATEMNAASNGDALAGRRTAAAPARAEPAPITANATAPATVTANAAAPAPDTAAATDVVATTGTADTIATKEEDSLHQSTDTAAETNPRDTKETSKSEGREAANDPTREAAAATDLDDDGDAIMKIGPSAATSATHKNKPEVITLSDTDAKNEGMLEGQKNSSTPKHRESQSHKQGKKGKNVAVVPESDSKSQAKDKSTADKRPTASNPESGPGPTGDRDKILAKWDARMTTRLEREEKAMWEFHQARHRLEEASTFLSGLTADHHRFERRYKSARRLLATTQKKLSGDAQLDHIAMRRIEAVEGSVRYLEGQVKWTKEGKDDGLTHYAELQDAYWLASVELIACTSERIRTQVREGILRLGVEESVGRLSDLLWEVPDADDHHLDDDHAGDPTTSASATGQGRSARDSLNARMANLARGPLAPNPAAPSAATTPGSAARRSGESHTAAQALPTVNSERDIATATSPPPPSVARTSPAITSQISVHAPRAPAQRQANSPIETGSSSRAAGDSSTSPPVPHNSTAPMSKSDAVVGDGSNGGQGGSEGDDQSEGPENESQGGDGKKDGGDENGSSGENGGGGLNGGEKKSNGGENKSNGRENGSNGGENGSNNSNSTTSTAQATLSKADAPSRPSSGEFTLPRSRPFAVVAGADLDLVADDLRIQRDTNEHFAAFTTTYPWLNDYEGYTRSLPRLVVTLGHVVADPCK